MHLIWIFNRIYFIIGVFLPAISLANKVRLQWSIDSEFPYSKVLDSGTVQELFCITSEVDLKSQVMLECPLSRGVCMANCDFLISNFHINCSKISRPTETVFQYKIKVFKNYEGYWRCQYDTESSRQLQLTVTNKPYINTLLATPNPVWINESLNITCQTMPMMSILDVVFQRVNDDNSTEPIPSTDATIVKFNNFTKSLIIKNVIPGKDDRIQCTVFTTTGLITSKILRTNIYYLPKSLSLSHSSTIRVNSFLTFQCNVDGGNPKPPLFLYRQRIGEYPSRLQNFEVLLTKYDNKADFFCEIGRLPNRAVKLRSNNINITVNYPPDTIELTEQPEGQLKESLTKTFFCFSQNGSQPESKIEWSLTDSLDRTVQRFLLPGILEISSAEKKSNERIISSTAKMTMLRNYNKYHVICSILYEGRLLLSRKKQIEVVFAPNVVELNSNPLGPIRESSSVALICVSSSSNPASMLRWYKVEPGKKMEEVTMKSHPDLVPTNFSGVRVSSSLSIHGVSRLNHGTLYKCVVSHEIVSSDISKEYFLNVLFPPEVTVYSTPKQVEEGDTTSLQCRTSGGNPSSSTEFYYSWTFCSVNSKYQVPSELNERLKPPMEYRKDCSNSLDGLSPTHRDIFNISSITGKYRGWYSCAVRSSGGTSIGYLFLNVLYMPILSRTSSNRIYVKVGANFALKFDISSNPTEIDIKWFFRPHPKVLSKTYNSDVIRDSNEVSSHTRREIKPYGRFESVLLENYTTYLKVTGVSFSDLGEYICEVRNSIGKKTLEFEVFPAADVSIPESSIRLVVNGRKVTVHFDPPTAGHFTHLLLRICPIHQKSGCKDMQLSNPLSGEASITMTTSPSFFTFRLLVYNGSTLLQITNTIQSDMAIPAGPWVDMSLEMMIAVIIGVVGIFILLFIALVTLIFLKCRRTKTKDDNSIVTANSSNQRRLDYMLLNSTGNNTLMKNGCHCFSNYPLELRSDNGSDHSAQSQSIYHPLILRRKLRDNAELSSLHSGGSIVQSPDLVMTERTSVNSGNMQNYNNVQYQNSFGNIAPNKVTLLSGRMHTLDNPKHEFNASEDAAIPHEMVFATVDDQGNRQAARIIPISPRNFFPEYPLHFQMNNMLPRNFELMSPPGYTNAANMCLRPETLNNQEQGEVSMTTNTNSHQDAVNAESNSNEHANNETEVHHADNHENS